MQGPEGKIPLPHAIFNGFLLVTVRALNSYVLGIMENGTVREK